MDATADTTRSVYTCPMHPSVRRDGPGRCPTCGMNLEPVKHAVLPRTSLVMGLCVFAAIAGYFLLAEHRAHLTGIVPYLLLLACPLIHFFMHRGHGRHSSQKGGRL
ncbi:MAG TPA: DUF2933 domain-containing protein [Polyangia bacterium]